MRRLPAVLILMGALVGPTLALTQGAGRGSTDASQIPSDGAAAPTVQVGADQIAPASNITTNQVSQSGDGAAPPPPVSSVAQGRNPTVAPVRGHDRCDPASISKAPDAECARIRDQEAAVANETGQSDLSPEVPANATASGLVNDVVNGGTGTVVPLPAH